MKLILFFAVAQVVAGCIPIERDKIFAADLSPFVPELGSVPPDSFIAFAPIPGAKRYLGSADIRRIGRRLQVDIEQATDLCVEYATAPLSDDAVLSAMRSALPADPVPSIEIVELSRYPVPKGLLWFPISGLDRSHRPPNAVRVWRGSVQYGSGARIPVWSRVRMYAERDCISATRLIEAGKAITEDQVRVVKCRYEPFDISPAKDLGDVVGRVSKSRIAEGTSIYTSALQTPQSVRAGAPVDVTVSTPGIALSFPAVAEVGGAVGDAIRIVDPTTGKRFRAAVTGSNKAKVLLK